jgi:Xaa-Pro aminopeptidase
MTEDDNSGARGRRVQGTPAAKTAGLPAMDVVGRLGRLRTRMASDSVDALLVTNPANIRYLTGFTGSAGVLFVRTADGAAPAKAATVLITDGRYETQSAEQLGAAGVEVDVEIAPAATQSRIGASLVTTADRRIGLEAAHVTWAAQRTYARSWFPTAELVATTGLVEALRRVKDPGEIARLAEAAVIADRALAGVRGHLDDRRITEIDFARDLDFEMGRLGADGPSFETIVASGPNSAKPHHRPTSRWIGGGEPVVLDFGARFDGYCSDMTRTVSVGELAGEMRDVLRVVTESQAAGVAAVAAGVEASAVDWACRSVIVDAGWGDRFVHGTGHGVGLDIHEAPAVASTSVDTLQAGHVVTVEPGVYLPGLGGVRIEDTVVVTGAGCYPLTTTPKDPCD